MKEQHTVSKKEKHVYKIHEHNSKIFAFQNNKRIINIKLLFRAARTYRRSAPSKLGTGSNVFSLIS